MWSIMANPQIPLLMAYVTTPKSYNILNEFLLQSEWWNEGKLRLGTGKLTPLLKAEIKSKQIDEQSGERA